MISETGKVEWGKHIIALMEKALEQIRADATEFPAHHAMIVNAPTDDGDVAIEFHSVYDAVDWVTRRNMRPGADIYSPGSVRSFTSGVVIRVNLYAYAKANKITR